MSEKNDRTSAKRKFTLERKNLLHLIEEKEYVEIISNSFAKVNDLWKNVQDAHEAYLRTLQIQSDDEGEDTWIQSIQREFRSTERSFYDVINHLKGPELPKVDLLKEEKELSKRKLVIERTLKEMKFSNSVTLLQQMINQAKPGENTKIISDQYNAMKNCYDNVEKAHETYILSLNSTSAEAEMNWIEKVQKIYRDCSMEYSTITNNTVKLIPCNQSTFKIEKMKLPTFNGNLKEYIQFKSDFMKYVLPEIESEKAAFVLKSCLGKEPLKSVKSIEDSVALIWARLDEKYGQPSMLAELVMNEIKRYKSLTDTDDKGLVEFIELVESSYNNLKLVNMEKEISNLSVVSLIEEKLPNMIRRKWAEEVSKERSVVDKRDPFPCLLKFLSQQRRVIEYISADLRSKTFYNNKVEIFNPIRLQHNCLIHKSSGHSTALCSSYLGKSNSEKVAFIKDNRACWGCLQVGHRYADCQSKTTCSINGCNKHHHETLHEAHVDGLVYQTSAYSSHNDAKNTMFQVMSIQCSKSTTNVNVLWDGGSNCSLLTFEKAKHLGLTGKPVKLSIQRVGENADEAQAFDSFIYDLALRDCEGKENVFHVYGVERITNTLYPVDYQSLSTLFSKHNFSSMPKPVGEIDVLIGIDYAAFHPQIIDTNKHLVLSKNCFGECISGSHIKLDQSDKPLPLIAHVTIKHMVGESIDDFINAESLRNTYKLANKNDKLDISIKEKREMELIENGLTFKDHYWEARYPWVRSPYYLPNNRETAIAILKSTEKRLMKDEDHMRNYKLQIQDMLERKVARKLSAQEIRDHDGPVYYITHHEVLKPKSVSTPYRIVFNASSNFKGHILNDYWAKGPTLINNLAGILV